MSNYLDKCSPEVRAALTRPSQGLLELRAFLATYTGPKDKAILAYQLHKNAELRAQEAARKRAR